MKISSITLNALVITLICLVYVREQVEIVKLSYKLRNKENSLAELVDQNRILLYNNTSLKAPQYLAGMLKQNSIELSLPQTSSVAKVRVVRKGNLRIASAAKTPSWKTQVMDAFVPKAQAALNTGN